MIKKTLYGFQARAALAEGVTKIADAVKVTLGPMGRNALIANSAYGNDGPVQMPVHVTKDGFTVANNFNVSDPFENAGVALVIEAAKKTVDQAGDGTTTTVVLLSAIVREGMELLNKGLINPIQLKREIDTAVAYVVGELQERSVTLDVGTEELLGIATISANNDPEIGQIIADAFAKIGKEGVINLERGRGVATEVKITEGYRFDKGWISPWFITDKEKQTVEYNNPLMLMYEKRITHHTQIIRALEIVIQQKRPLIIICEDASDEGLATLITNHIQNRFHCCVVKTPFGAQDMEDIALITGGTYISDSKGFGIKEIEFENFGSAARVRITKDETVIIGGNTDHEALNRLLSELRANLADAKNEDEAYPIEKRIARLTGGIALISVGAPSETEMNEKLDRYDDAVRATKAALAEGYVPGGGRLFQGISGQISRTTKGAELVARALLVPFQQICENAGVNPMEVWGRMEDPAWDFGYNAKTDTVENLPKAGVIDPTKVLRCSIQNAASLATMLLTSEVLIADIP